jgi:hypothetical protein
MARLCESIGRVSAYVEDLVSQRPRVTFYYEGQAVSVRVPRSPKQVAYTYSRLRSAFKLADDVIISAFFVDTHNGGPLCPFRLVAMLRGGEDCSLVTVPRLIHPPSELPLPPQKMRPELVEWHTVSWVKLKHVEERERAAETARMIAALETSGFCYLTVTPKEGAIVARALQAARRYFAMVWPTCRQRNAYTYIYIYIEREREKEKERARAMHSRLAEMLRVIYAW